MAAILTFIISYHDCLDSYLNILTIKYLKIQDSMHPSLYRIRVLVEHFTTRVMKKQNENEPILNISIISDFDKRLTD